MSVMDPVEQLLSAIRRLEGERGRVLVAIDGRCASGKTTLAARLVERLGGGVVHMDDFFLRPEQRTPERLARPGENVDWERFLAEVLLPLRQGGKVVYRPYDCRTQSMGDPITLERSAVVVVEGSYSCHPELWESYDLHVFLDVDPEEDPGAEWSAGSSDVSGPMDPPGGTVLPGVLDPPAVRASLPGG